MTEYEVTHTHNAGQVPVTVRVAALDLRSIPGYLRVTVIGVGGRHLQGAPIPLDRVVSVVEVS